MIFSLKTPQPSERGDQELSKTFSGLKNGPLLRELQAFKDWQLFQLHIEKKSKNYQSLKAYNFLNNGPNYNPEKVLESSWSPLSDGCGVFKLNIARLRGETRCAREFVVSVVSFTQISRDFRGKRDVRESSWCLWCPLLLKTPQSLPHISFPPEISRDLTKGHHRHHTKTTKSTKNSLLVVSLISD